MRNQIRKGCKNKGVYSMFCFGPLLQHGHTDISGEQLRILQQILQACRLQTLITKRKYILQPGLHVTVSALFPFCIPASQTV